MAERKKSNLTKSILKASSAFGGIQFLSILCSIIRTKLIVIWIGPIGIGLFALYNSVIEMVRNIISLGMTQSAVRDISTTVATKSDKEISTIIKVVRRWAWYTGIAGTAVLLFGSPLFSHITFGNYDHTIDFVILSIVILLNMLTTGEQAILQGTSALRKMAQASFCGILLGMIASAPLFYFFKVDSIVPSLVLYAILSGVFVFILRDKTYRIPVSLSLKETYQLGKGFLKLGAYITLTDIVSQACSYAFISYLNRVADTEMVGYYQAGYTLIGKYAGLILTSLSVEYFPRLSKVCNSRIRMNIFISKEINIALCLLAPCLSAFILFRPLIIDLLYDSNFQVISNYIALAVIGTIFRAISWCMAFAILAKGNGKIYLITEFVSTATFLLLYIPAFHLWGITGFGIAFIVWYAVYALIVGFYCYHTFNIRLNSSSFKWTAWALIATSSTFICTLYELIIPAVVICIITIGYSLSRMRKILL